MIPVNAAAHGLVSAYLVQGDWEDDLEERGTTGVVVDVDRMRGRVSERAEVDRYAIPQRDRLWEV
jgi:hypothetical protein